MELQVADIMHEHKIKTGADRAKMKKINKKS
jgi:hypothetical protein